MKELFKADSQTELGVPAPQAAAEIATLPPPYSIAPALAPAEAICDSHQSLKDHKKARFIEARPFP